MVLALLVMAERVKCHWDQWERAGGSERQVRVRVRLIGEKETEGGVDSDKKILKGTERSV